MGRNGRIAPAALDCFELVLSTWLGLTADALSTGMAPKNSVTNALTTPMNPSRRHSGRRSSQAGKFDAPNWAARNGAATAPNATPREQERKASSPLSTSD